MDYLFEKSTLLLRSQQQTLVRSIMEKIDWNNRLIGILGARGTGKITLLLQYARKNFGSGNEVLYITLDDIFLAKTRYLM